MPFRTSEARAAYAKRYRQQNRSRIRTQYRAYRQEHRDEIRQKDRERSARDREKRQAGKRAHRERHIDRYQAQDRLRNYGLTPEQFDQLLKAQNNACAICERPFVGIRRGKGQNPPCVDHCHATERVRGLLCGHCNTALGQMDDNPERLQRAIEYLGRTHDPGNPRVVFSLHPLEQADEHRAGWLEKNS